MAFLVGAPCGANTNLQSVPTDSVCQATTAAPNRERKSFKTNKIKQ